MASLEGWGSAIELHPREAPIVYPRYLRGFQETDSVTRGLPA